MTAYKSRKKERPAKTVEFRETLAPVVPYAPTAPIIPRVHPGLSGRSLRAGLYLIWALAAVFAGVSIGLWSLGKMRLATAEVPVPLAKSTVKVAAAPSPAIVQTSPSSPALTGTARPTSVTQAQAGNIVATAGAGLLQPFGTASSLQPGFSHYGLVQGNRGTAPANQ